MSDPQSLNRYAYVRNNPVRYAEPSGELLIDKADAGYGAATVGNVRGIQAAATATAVSGTVSVGSDYVLRHRTAARVSIPNTRSRAASVSNSAGSKAAQYRWYKAQAVQKAKNQDPVSTATAKTISKGAAEKRRTYEPLDVPTVSKRKVEVFPWSNVEKARNDGFRARKTSLNGDGSDGGCTIRPVPGKTTVGDKPVVHVLPWVRANETGLVLIESDAEDKKPKKVNEPPNVKRKAKKLSPEAKVGYAKAIKALKNGDTRGLNDHRLGNNRSGQRAIDMKGTGKGRDAGRIIYEILKNGEINIIEILTNHDY